MLNLYKKKICPACNEELPISLVERWKPIISRSYAFHCPNCNEFLILNYWNPKVFAINLIFVFSIIFILVLGKSIGISYLILSAVLFFITLLSWLLITRFIDVTTAAHGSNKSRTKQPWE